MAGLRGVILHGGCDSAPEVARVAPVPRAGVGVVGAGWAAGQPGVARVCRLVIACTRSGAQGAWRGRCGSSAEGIVIAPDGRHLYLRSGSGVTVIDTVSNSVVDTVPNLLSASYRADG